MKIALIGYGKMGQTIERLALERGHIIVLKATSLAPVLPEHLKGADVAIEFTEPTSAVKNIFSSFEAGVPIVCGTTGWFGRLHEVKEQCNENNGTLFYASNFSIGVNLFFQTVHAAARMLNNYPEYQVRMKEIHHLEKKDAPSGTAITLSEILSDELDGMDGWQHADEGQEGKISIEAIREGDVKGTHEVLFTSGVDEIEFTHRAHSREGFALGALKAAEWLQHKKGCFTMTDLLKTEHT
ncbi:MAG: 4-hydroxy-tetrahydrodipicolinate reductase [Cryomorphaceae bacterium]|nr:4-hydroxy-tetrahydrodipicolinate reductase [Cryomorphaceae bacterium]